MKVEVFLDVGRGKKSRYKKENKFPHKKARHEGECNYNEMGHYSKDCPKPKPGNGGSKVIAFTANLAQGESNHLIFLKRKVSKRDMLCLLNTKASHNFITRKSAERMEFQLEELKGPIEMYLVNGIPHPTTIQARNVPLQLKNWRGKVDLLVSTLGGMECILGMEFITHNNVLIEVHNKLIRIPSKNGII
jgi:predicted aspartyl protease